MAHANNIEQILSTRLYSISKRYGHSVEQIARWNRLVPPYNLTVGDI